MDVKLKGDRVSVQAAGAAAFSLGQPEGGAGEIAEGEKVLLREDVQLLRGREEWEPPYGVLVLTDRSIVLGWEGKRHRVPLAAIEQVGCDSVEGTYHQLYGKDYIKIGYRREGKRVFAPLFACAQGAFGGTLGSSRDRRTGEVRKKIEMRLKRLSAKSVKPKSKAKGRKKR